MSRTERQLIEDLGLSAARLVRQVAADPALGPTIAAAVDRHFRETLRLELIELAPQAWDLLRADSWPPHNV